MPHIGQTKNKVANILNSEFAQYFADNVLFLLLITNRRLNLSFFSLMSGVLGMIRNVCLQIVSCANIVQNKTKFFNYKKHLYDEIKLYLKTTS